MFEDNENEDLYGTGGLGALNVSPVMSSPDDAMAAWQSAQKLVAPQINSNLARISAARSRIRDARVGPSQAEQLLAIASALGRPTKSGSFGETMGNLSGALLEQATAKREAEEKRQEMLEKYGMQMGDAQLRALMTAAGQAGEVYSRTAAAKAAAAAADRADKAANRPGEKERLIARALSLPEDDPERKLILASITGSPENIAAAVSRAAGIQATKPPPSVTGGKTPPKYKRVGDKIYKWSPE